MSNNNNNIPGPLSTLGQFPVDKKTRVLKLSDIKSLGTNNQKAYTYFEYQPIRCIEDGSLFIWREVLDTDEVGAGLLNSDFTYPTGSKMVADGISYSGRTFNFFKVPEPLDLSGFTPDSILIVKEDGKSLQPLALGPEFRVVIIDGVKTLTIVNESTDIENPSAPQSLTIVMNDLEGLLSWTPAVDNVAVSIYQLEYTTVGDPDFNNKEILLTSNSSLPIELPKGHYLFRVRAKDTSGNYSEYSNVVNQIFFIDDVAPTAPQQLGVEISVDNASLTWLASTDNVGVSQYTAYCTLVTDNDWSLAQTIDTTDEVFTCLFPNLADGVYKFKVHASDAAGNVSLSSNVVTKTVTSVNTKPVVTLVGDSVVTVQYSKTYNELGATAVDAEDGDITSDIIINATSINVNQLGSYYVSYWVTDSQGLVSDTVTREVRVVDIIAPSVPGNLLNTVNGNDVTLTWDASTDNVAVENYRVSFTTSSDLTWANALHVDVSGTSYIAINLANDTYKFRVKAKDTSDNYSEYTDATVAIVNEVVIDNEPPTIPTNFSVVTDQAIASLSWTASIDNVEVHSYEIEYRNVLEQDWTNKTVVTAVGTSKDIELTMGTYLFRMRAKDTSDNYSGYTNEVSGTILISTMADNTVFFGQSSSNATLNSALFEQLDRAPSSIVSPAYKIYAEVTDETEDTLFSVPYLGTPTTNTEDLNKVTHFVAVPIGHKIKYSVSASISGEVFYNDLNVNLYTTFNTIIAGQTYVIYIFTGDNPLGDYVNVTIGTDLQQA